MARFWQVLLGVCGLLFLAALLFPLFQRVPENQFNPRTGCMSNMKQIGIALIQYAQDSDNALPPPAASNESGWREAIYSYVESTQVYHCPDDQRTAENSPDNLPKSYAANALCLSNGKKKAAILGLPATIVLVTDTRGFDGEEWDMTSPSFLPSSGRELYTHKPSHYFYQHPLGTLNVLFADGHVKGMKPDATLTPINLWTPSNAPFAGSHLTNARTILTHAQNE